jgi:RluA family pseudouridine synthase
MPEPKPAANLTQCPILHRDRFLIVVNKPAGVLSHPNKGGGGGAEPSAFEGRYDLEKKVFEGPAGKVWLIHRLDQDTSGALLGALDERTALRCRQAFEEETVHKQYLALVRGALPGSGTWLDHLAVSRGGGRVRTAVVKGRTPNAELRFRNLGHDPTSRLTLLEIELITGRTHQIRVQAAARQHPVAGDDIYGDFNLNRRLKSEQGLRRLFLHALRLEMKHPASGQKLVVEAPLAEELQGVCGKLGLGS